MSFKWKWIFASFGIQLVVGVFFAATWYIHFYGQAQERYASEKTQLNYLVSTFASRSEALKSGKVPSDLLSDMHRMFESQYAELVREDEVMVRQGEKKTFDEESSWLYEFSKLHGQRNVLVSAKIPNSEYQINIQPKYEDYFGRRDRAIETVLGLTLISSIASALMLLSLSALMIGRLDKLKDKAIALQAGQMGVRVQVGGSDEISMLGRAFNEMADSIQANIARVSEGKRELEVERNRLDSILSSLNTGVAYLDGQSNVQYVNRSMAKMCGIAENISPRVQLLELLMKLGVAGSQRQELAKLMRESLYARRSPVEFELPDGRVYRMRFCVATDSARSEHGVLLIDDVSLHKDVKNLQEEVETDPLTRVLNRRGFDLALSRRIPKLMADETLGMIYIDLDGFKAVNDTLGHKAGDQILRSAASILTSTVRNADAVARLGGDEFAVVVNRASESLLKNMCHRIIDSFSKEPLFQRIIQNHGLPVSCSLGVAIYPEHAETAQQLIEVADTAMYQAKRSGKSCYRVASPLQTGAAVQPDLDMEFDASEAELLASTGEQQQVNTEVEPESDADQQAFVDLELQEGSQLDAQLQSRDESQPEDEDQTMHP